MKTKVDLENWNRKEHFTFFNQFEEPFHSITVELDCQKSYEFAKQNGHSVFLVYLHKALLAANSIDAFKMRIENNEVFLYNEIHASPTIDRPDGTFGFSYIDFYEDFLTFQEKAKIEIERVRNSSGLVPASAAANVIHFSSLPWLKFTSLSHARSFSFKDSCPKISFGRILDFKMPVSITVNHALVDGYHVALFVEAFQKILDEN